MPGSSFIVWLTSCRSAASGLPVPPRSPVASSAARRLQRSVRRLPKHETVPELRSISKPCAIRGALELSQLPHWHIVAVKQRNQLAKATVGDSVPRNMYQQFVSQTFSSRHARNSV